MITKPTVLILGAGASVDVGYPLAGGLVDEIVALSHQKEVMSPAEWYAARDGGEYRYLTSKQQLEEACKEFANKLSASGCPSIDTFLESREDLRVVGKFLIAKIIKHKEYKYPNFNRDGAKKWYQSLLQSIVSGCKDPLDAITKTDLRIITFNYDRSLEYFLMSALSERCNISEDAAIAKMRESNLYPLHLHGDLGSLETYEYGEIKDDVSIKKASQNIRVVSELNDLSGNERSFVSEEFKEANEQLQAAERIIFMGFSYDPISIDRFNFFNNISSKTEIHLLTYKMSKNSLHKLHLMAGKWGPSITILKFYEPDLSCSDLLSDGLDLTL
ncbi:MAG: hypothetical protein RIG82_13250 [Phycisphaeraceae bacterium]